MSPFQAVTAGIRRVNRAPAILIAMWAITVASGIPLALIVRGAIAQQLGASLVAGQVADGASADWMSEFGNEATGLTTTFGPAVIGFTAVLDNASAFMEAAVRPAAVRATAVGYVLIWTLLAGGIIDRYARDRSTHGDGFFKACGLHFPALVRLGIVSATVYGILFGWIHPWLLDETYERLVRNVNVERTAFLIRLSFYGVFLFALATFNLLFDFAKVRLVSEGRYSALGALRAAGRLVVRQPLGVAALYLSDVLLFGLVILTYALVAPGAGSAGWSMWLGVAISQAYIAARLWVKLVFWSSETVYFQGSGIRDQGSGVLGLRT
jgi:hypothetical protein